MISKKLFFILIAAVAVLLGISVWLGSMFVRNTRPNPAGPSEYSAVYLVTGDIYYGKIHWFPRLHLTNVWVLQRPAAQDGQFGIMQFARAFWQPVDEVYLNSDQVVFWTRLRNDSQLVSYFNNPAATGFQGSPLPAGEPLPTNIPPSAVPSGGDGLPSVNPTP
jgi:hypothetical protein